jgi:hypothetical protein
MTSWRLRFCKAASNNLRALAEAFNSADLRIERRVTVHHHDQPSLDKVSEHRIGSMFIKRLCYRADA